MQQVIDGILTDYQRMGDGEENLVILPGWKGTIQEWMPVAEALKEKYTVTVISLPGFGNSANPPVNWGIYEYAEFVKKFLTKQGIKKVIMLGHSFGGRVGILLAAETKLITKLILVDAAGMEIKSLKVQILKRLWPIAGWLPEKIRNWFRSEDWRSAGQMRPILAKVINQPLRDQLVKIICPTLIIWGEFDKELTLTEAKMLNRGIKNSQLRIVWGATHWPHHEKTDEFIRILKEEGI